MKKGIIAKIPKKDTRLEWDNFMGIWVLPVVAIVVKVILLRITE